MEQWYLARGKVKAGPFSRAQLQAAAAKGDLRATDMVLQAGAQRWLAAAEVCGLFPAPADKPVFAIPMAVPVSPAPPAAVLAQPAMPPAAGPVAPSTAAGGPRQPWLWVAAGGIGLCALVVVPILIFGGNSDSPKTVEPVAQNGQPLPPGKAAQSSQAEGKPLPAAALKPNLPQIQLTDLSQKKPTGEKIATGPKGDPGDQPLKVAPDAPPLPKQRPTMVLQLGHTHIVKSVAFSPDGKQVLTGSADKTARLWDVASGREIRAFRHSKSVESVAFSPDGNQVLTGSWENTARLWDAASGKVIRDFQGHTRLVGSVTFSPDGKQVLTGSWDNTARLWDAATGKEIRTFRGHKADVYSVAFSPDGKQVLTGSGDKTARLWDPASGKEIYSLQAPASVRFVAFSPDGKQLLTGNGYAGGPGRPQNVPAVRLWDAGSGQEIRSFYAWGYGAESVAFSPDGKQVLTGAEKDAARLWDAGSGKEIRSFGGHTDQSSVAFSPDGKHVLTGGGKTAQLWDAARDNIKELRTFEGLVRAVTSVAFSPDGKQVLTLSGNLIGTGEKTLDVRLWDAASAKVVTSFSFPAGTVTSFSFPVGTQVPVGPKNSVAFSPDGKQVVTRSNNEIRLWDAASGQEIHPFRQSEPLNSVVFSPDGKQVLTVSRTGQDVPIGQLPRGLPVPAKKRGDTVRLWDAAARKQIHAFGSGKLVHSVAFSRDGKRVLTVTDEAQSPGRDFVVRLWDAASGKEIKHFSLRAHPVTSAVVGKRPKSGGPGLAPSSFLSQPQPMRIRSLAFSPDGNQLLTGCENKIAQLWDTAKGKFLRSFGGHARDFSFEVSSVAFSPDGKQVLARARDGTARLCDAASGKEIRVFEGWDAVVFSPDSKQVLAVENSYRAFFSGKPPNTARLWDAASGKEIHALQGHTDELTCLAFSPDGKQVLTGSADGTARLWNAVSGQEVGRLLGFADGTWAVVTPANYYMAPKGVLKGVAFRMGKQVFPFDQFDLKFNRPDKVLEGIGLASPEMVAAYRHAYQKRLKRMKFTEDMFSDDFHMPEIAVSTGAKFTTSERALKLKVEASDSRYPLDRLHIYVNGVPVHDSGGINLRKQQVKTWQQAIDIELSAGKNKIDVSVLNEKGAESLKETVQIDCQAPAAKPDLYVVAVGVSDYQDQRYRLTYADKDARDLADLFESKRERFSQVKVLRILNRDATRENILKARDFLNKSQVDDHVVLFFAGHGLLDAKLDYYFGTADLDFKKPAQRGLPYEAIEGLLDGIRARKKLLLMDTCHSGELEKEEVKVVESEKLPDGEVKERSFRGLERLAPRLGLRNSYQLLQEMFADLRRGTGAVVIASAGGAEYALESEAWQNGVFTYALLRGLNGEADRDKDGRVRVSKLRDFVQQEVRRLTRGRQAPTARRDNLEVDFTVD